MEKTNVGSVVGGEEPSWEELLGSKNWEGLLDPLDLSLRCFILRCGDFSEYCYDAFNCDESSPYYGTCHYGEKSFFHRMKPRYEYASVYEVSSFLYATSKDPSDTSNMMTTFMGYVAVTNDAASEALGRREIYVVWRGTQTNFELADDVFESGLVPLTPRLGARHAPKVMQYWLDVYTCSNPSSQFSKESAQDQLRKTINQLMQKYKDEKNLSIVVTGHSLGGALAVLSAYDLVDKCVGDNIPVAAVVFACPRVGDSNFKETLQKHPNLKILHTRNASDIVPTLPPDLMGYRAVGVEMQIDSSKSPSLKTIGWQDLAGWHNLEVLLHTVAGWHGQEKPFELAVKRSLTLVNKSSQLLNDEYKIPANWWVVENKGMVLNHKGDWVLAAPLLEDY